MPPSDKLVHTANQLYIFLSQALVYIMLHISNPIKDSKLGQHHVGDFRAWAAPGVQTTTY